LIAFISFYSNTLFAQIASDTILINTGEIYFVELKKGMADDIGEMIWINGSHYDDNG
jgi:hypothetical protein